MTGEDAKRSQRMRMKSTRTRKDDRMEAENWLKTRTLRTVLFLRGRGCNIPLAYPRHFVVSNVIVLVSGR